MDIDHLHSIRAKELDSIVSLLSQLQSSVSGELKILELGSGTGWQAKKLSELGFTIEAIDIDLGTYQREQVWPIKIYDGSNIPFPDEHFDVLLSSNVLEHIPHLDSFHEEMKRVLKSDGTAVHIVPSGSWRFWTNVAFYPHIAKSLAKRLFAKFIQIVNSNNEATNVQDASCPKGPAKAKIPMVLPFPTRHGEVGNAISEIYHFSKHSWTGKFERAHWKISSCYGNQLFYTGHMVFGASMKIPARVIASNFLGSSCHIFTLKKSHVEN